MSVEVPDKTCQNDCRFVVKTEMTTCTYYQPIYDKNGNNINPDGNTISGEMICSVCDRKWLYKKRYGNYAYEEMQPKNLTSSLMSGIIDLNDQGC